MSVTQSRSFSLRKNTHRTYGKLAIQAQTLSILMTLSTHLHPATVHFPIAFLFTASLTGLLYLYWQPQPTLVVLTWWGMRLGWLGTWLAVLSGLWAQGDLPTQAPYRSLLNWHISTGLALLVVYGLPLYQQWLYGSKRRQKARQPQNQIAGELLDNPQARLWLSACFLVGIGLLLASGWNGGRLVFDWGVHVMTK